MRRAIPTAETVVLRYDVYAFARRTFRFTSMKNPDPLQAAIHRDGLRGPGTSKHGVAPR